MSYYDRAWQGFVEVRDSNNEVLDGGGWLRMGVVGSVEHGLSVVKSNPIPGLDWRIVDGGGNVYESGKFEVKTLTEFKFGAIDPAIVERQRAYYESLVNAPVHIRASERRRLLEESLKEKDDHAA